MKNILFLFLLVFMLPALVNAQAEPTELSPRQFRKMSKNSGVILLDVRSLQEYNDGHMKGAIHADAEKQDFNEKTVHLDPNRTYLLYCRTSRRSVMAAEKLKARGFQNLFILKGGLGKWKWKLHRHEE